MTSMIFYKETNLKQTPAGEIPQDWDVANLENVVSSFENGIWGENPVPGEQSHPVIRSTEVTHDGKIDLSTVAFRRIPAEKADKYRLRDGDILLVGSSGSSQLIGRAALFKRLNDATTYLFSNFMIRMRPKGINPGFLYYFFNSPTYYHFLRHLQQTSTGLRNLPRKEFIQIKLPCPPPLEQQKIAEVFSTIDEAIQKTSEVVAKTEQLKKALMRELLTKGIGHTEFEDTEIGRIPKEWRIVKLGEVGTFQYGVTTSAKKGDTGIKLLRITDIRDNGVINWLEVPYCEVSDAELKKYALRTGEVLFARIGATTGKTCYVDQQIESVFGSYLIRFLLNADKENLITKFLHHYTQSEMYWLQVNRIREGQLKKGLNTALLRNLRFPLPPLREQQEIASILSTIDKKLEVERNEKVKLERIKQGLMDLLLTGKIRIKLS